MSTNNTGSQHNRQRPPRAPRGARRTRDRRLCQDAWVPAYLPNYTEQVGAVAIVMYMLLSRACIIGWEPRWPSLAQLGAMIGVSRSTAERALRALRRVGLIETEDCIDDAGQHSNYWDLWDPFDLREKLDSLGTEDAGAGTPDGAPPSQVMGGDSTVDGGAPSPVTAPSLRSEDLKSVCAEEQTHTPGAALAQEDMAGAAVQIVERWCAQLPPGAPGWRSAHTAEIAWQAGELLQRGWRLPELLASIDAPGRDRTEWPRVWAARHGTPALKAAKRPAEAAQRAQERADEAAAAVREQEGEAWRLQMQKLRERIHSARGPATVAAIAATEEEGASAAAAAGGDAARPAGGAPPAAAAAEG